MKRTALRVAALVACAGIASAARADLLGTAGTFAVLGATTVTNTGLTTLVGDLGVSPGTAITGFGPGVVTGGTIHSNDSVAINAQADAQSAYGTLAALTPSVDLTGQNLGGLTLTPGYYHFSSSASLTGTLTLNAQGQAHPLFVFQVGSTLITDSGSSIVEINGTDASSVYFLVGSSATLGTDSSFIGTIIAQTSDTLTHGASVNGRVIALNGAVTLDDNHVAFASAAAVPEPGSVVLFALGLTTLVALRKRARAAA